jgi:hypothetical protein
MTNRSTRSILLVVLSVLLGILIGRASSVAVSEVPHTSLPPATALASTPLGLSLVGVRASRMSFHIGAMSAPGALIALSIDYCDLHEASAPFDSYRQTDASGSVSWDWPVPSTVPASCHALHINVWSINARETPGDRIATYSGTLAF